MNPTTKIPDDRSPNVSPPAESNAASVPGGVYLCQVTENVSCGACCGLYNCSDASRAGLHERLTFQTERFREVPREVDAIDDFRVQMERREPRQRPYPDFYHCPFLGLAGFFDAIERRLGLLLEPVDITGSPGARQTVAEFLGLKLVWPFHDPAYKGPANYFFNDGLYSRPLIDYERLGARPSPHDVLLRELSSAFSSRAKLTAAEARIEELLVRIVRQVNPRKRANH